MKPNGYRKFFARHQKKARPLLEGVQRAVGGFGYERQLTDPKPLFDLQLTYVLYQAGSAMQEKNTEKSYLF